MAQIITTNSGWWWGGWNVNLIAWDGINITQQIKYQLPEWYTQIEWISTQSSGQYIDSQMILWDDCDVTFIADVPYVNGGALLFGNNTNSNISYTLNLWSWTLPRSRFGASSMQNVIRRAWKHTYKVSKNGVDVDTDVHFNRSPTPWTFIQAASFYIFSARSSTTHCPANTKIYYGSVVRNWDIIWEFIPCVQIESGDAWLYDIANNRFLPISSWELNKWDAVVEWQVISFVNDAWYLAGADVVDNLTSTATNKPLSANQWRILDGKISDLMAMGKFLSLWDAANWSPISFPRSTPYTYHTWDYFMVETLATWDDPNYRPTWSSYTWATSSVEETWDVQVWDFYVYDWSIWLLASNHWKTVSFANIAWDPYDNTNLSNALANKQTKLVAWADISISAGSEIYTLPEWYTQLDYIGLDGVGYFNTGIKLADTDRLDIAFTTDGSYSWTYFLSGNNGSAWQSVWMIIPSANTIQWNGRPTGVNLPTNTKIWMQLKSWELTYSSLYGYATKTFTGGSVSSSWVCLIGAAWESSTVVGTRRFYWLIHKWFILDSNDQYRFKGVPCKNSLDQLWIYDLVSNTFIQTAVTATITEWPEATEADIISFTNASRYIKNSATGDGSITISGNPAPWNNWVNIWPWSYAAWYSVWIGSTAYSNGGYSVAIGNASAASSTSAIGIGRWAKAQAVNGVAIGRDAAVSGLNWIAIWKDAKNSSAYAIQIGKGTISGASNECQFYVGFDGINQNWKMLDGNTWLIPDARLSSNVQTVSNLVTTLTWADDTHYPSAKAVADAITSAWGWDMLKSTYDPNNVEADAFDYTNFINTPTIPTQTSDLVNDSWFLTNTATWTSALTVIGTATAKTQSTNVGALSQSTANYGTALWSYSQANGSHAIAIWNYARTTWQYTIQLWKGTTSANNKLYAGFENNNYELLDGTTWKIPNDRLNMDATPTDSSTNAVTSWGVRAAISAINWIIIAATAPLSPTEWMVWYDTTNDVLKTYDGSNWNEVGGGSNDVNTKTYYLSSSSDTTTAQSAYDWYAAGKNPIVVLASTEYFVRSASATELNFTSGNFYSVNSASWYSYDYVKWLKFALSSWTVTSVSSSNMDGWNYLKVGYNYSTPYTPQYDWSPATKKYVDDNAWIQNDTTWTTSTIDAEWVWTDAEFKALSSYWNKIYNIIE